MTDDDLARLTAAWRSRWGGSPVAYELRDRFAERWVRFHSLPGSKRYAETEAEYGILLNRHHTLIQELGAEDGLYLIAGYFDGTAGRSLPDPEIHPDAVRWLTVLPDERSFFTIPLNLYASYVTHTSAELDPFLRRVADDQIAFAIIAPPDLRWLYHPYDGGGDVIAESVQDREALKSRHEDWLSKHPRGM